MKSNIKGQASVHIQAPLAKVWDALTKPEIIKKYFFGTNTTTTWKVGDPIYFDGEWEGKTYHDKGTIKEIVKNKRIRYDYWSSMSGIEDKPENYVTITYELVEKDNGVTVTVTQENIPDEKRKDHSEENWKKVLQGLKEMLEKRNELTI